MSTLIYQVRIDDNSHKPIMALPSERQLWPDEVEMESSPGMKEISIYLEAENEEIAIKRGVEFMDKYWRRTSRYS